MSMEAPQPDPFSKNWYQKWWVWALIVLGIFVVIGVATSGSGGGDDEAVATTVVGESTTTEAEETTTTTEAEETTTTTEAEETTTTTEAEETTTTTEAEETTTTTTLPPILAEGEGTGDDVIELDLDMELLVIEITHDGDSNFSVISLDASFETIDLLVNEIGPYEGTRGMQLDGVAVSGLEITANGNWTYQIRPLMQEPFLLCPVDGRGDDVILLTNFVDSGGAVDLTHDGDSNFSITAHGGDGRDLLVNEIGPYSGTVRVSAGLVGWDITADGNWSIDC